MTPRDRSSSRILALVLAVAVIAGLVSAPSILPATAIRRHAAADARRPSRRGPIARASSGHPVSVSPLTAHDQRRPRPRRPRLQRPRRLGPDGDARADLADELDGRPPARTGRSSCATGRPLAGRRAGHRRGRRLHGRALQDPAYTGPEAASWRRGHGHAGAIRAPSVHAGDAARRVPPGGDPADRCRRTSLADIPVDAAGRRAIRAAARRVGRRSRVASLDDQHAELDPGGATLQAEAPAPAAIGAPDRTRSRPPSPAPPRAEPVPYLAGIDFSFFDDAAGARRRVRERRARCRGRAFPAIDARPGATPGDRVSSATRATTLTAVLLNLRPGHPEPRTRRCGRRCSRRSTGAAHRPTRSRRPPTGLDHRSRRRRGRSNAAPTRRCRTTAVAAEARSRPAGRKAAGGWIARGRRAPLAIELITPGRGVEPGGLRRRRGRRRAGARSAWR